MTMTHMVSLGLNELSLVKQKQGQIERSKVIYNQQWCQINQTDESLELANLVIVFFYHLMHSSRNNL